MGQKNRLKQKSNRGFQVWNTPGQGGNDIVINIKTKLICIKFSSWNIYTDKDNKKLIYDTSEKTLSIERQMKIYFFILSILSPHKTKRCPLVNWSTLNNVLISSTESIKCYLRPFISIKLSQGGQTNVYQKNTLNLEPLIMNSRG